MKTIIYTQIRNPILNKISPLIINNLISPHGITDISHSIETNNFKNLLKINLSSYFLIDFLNRTNLDIISNLIFLFYSIIHFKNDFLLVKKKKLFSLLFIFSIIIINYINFTLAYSYFLFYMALIHVPLHYKENFWHIKKRPSLNLMLILFVSTISNIIYGEYLILKKPIITNSIKSIVISHIIYNEIYNSIYKSNKL